MGLDSQERSNACHQAHGALSDTPEYGRREPCLLSLIAVLQVLLEETTQRVPAALHGLAVFVDTLRLLVEAQQSVNAPSVSPPHSLLAQPKEGSGILSTATPMEDDQQAAMLAQSADDAGAAAIDSAEAKRPKEVSPSAGIDALTSSLMPSPQV